MATTEKTEKQLLQAPQLPNVVQGDGRYLMSLLQEYLKSMAMQVNLANGFSAEEINPEQGKYPTPRNFFLTFNRVGGVLTWTHLADVSNLAYYETRTDTNVGVQYGLLDRTVESTSTNIPTTYVGTIYLYAVSKTGEVSAPSTINYTKARPDAPTDIAITPNSEGSLITFLDIPSNCIGANIYIGGHQYQSLSNVYLYTGTSDVEKIEVAYYDQFGEGEHGVLWLILPDVQGFLVERNGPELDFYWEPVNVYGISYIVKVGETLDWDKAVTLFTTKTNDKNRYIYPNVGEYYLMVKAMDEHGNFSKNAAFFLIGNDEDIHRNVILEYDQNKVAYNGNKVNVYYDPLLGGITLDRDANYGEYIMDVQLPQKYRARNWLEANLVNLDSSGTSWENADFMWDDAEKLSWSGNLGDLQAVELSQQIALKQGDDANMLFSAQLNGNLLTESSEKPTASQNADNFQASHWAKGLYISDLTRLEYSLSDMLQKFSLTINLKKTDSLSDTVIVALSDGNHNWLLLGYDLRLNRFYLSGSDGNVAFVDNIAAQDRDWLTFSFTQGENIRKLFMHSLAKSTSISGTVEGAPLSTYTKLYCYTPTLSEI